MMRPKNACFSRLLYIFNGFNESGNMKRFLKIALSAIFLLYILFISSTVFAHPLDMYGFGARANGMGGAFCAVADDYSALYYNIGGLTQIDGNHFTVGYIIANPYLSLDLKPAPGTSKRSAQKLHKLEKDQVDVDPIKGYYFAIAVKPHPIVALGLAAYLPEGLVVRLQPLDAHVPTFFMHEHRSQRVVSLLGVSIRVLPTLSIGCGIRMFLKTKGYFNLPIEMTQKNTVLSEDEKADEAYDPDAELMLDFPLTTYPFFGIHYQPIENLRLGISYQYSYQTDIDIDVNVDLVIRNYAIQLSELKNYSPGLFPLKTVIELNIPQLGDTPLRIPVELEGLEGELTVNALIPLEGLISISDHWKPQTITFGAAYDPIDALTLSLDVVWFDWSEFPSPDMRIKINDININLQTLPASVRGRIKSLSVPILGTIGPLPPVSIDVPGMDVQLTIPVTIEDVTAVTTHDILVPKFGMEYRFPSVESLLWDGDVDIALRGGYMYKPTPFKADNGEANLIDSDTHSVSLGFGTTFNDLLTLDFYGQYQYFTPIKVHKDRIDQDMPFESYYAKGHIVGGGFSASIEW